MRPVSFLKEVYSVSWGDLCYMKENPLETTVTGIVGPLLYLLAFGFGLGGSMEGGSENYIKFILPGIISLSTLSTTFGTVSMKILIQRKYYMSFDELLLCPVHISSVVFGKTFAGVVRALISCSIIMGVGLLISPGLVIDPLVFVMIFIAGQTFAMFGLLAGMVVTKTQKLSLFSSIVIVPMTFLCGTLFDVSSLPDTAGAVIYALPLTHVSEVMRCVMLGEAFPWLSLAVVLAYTVFFYLSCHYVIKNNMC